MKNKLLTLCLVATMTLSLVACGNSNDTKVIESNSTQKASGSEQAASTQAGYVFNYDGMDIPVDADVAPIIDKLGILNLLAVLLMALASFTLTVILKSRHTLMEMLTRFYM